MAATVSAALLAAGCSSGDDASGTDPTTTVAGDAGESSDGFPQSGPPGDPAPTITADDVDAAVEAFVPLAEDAMAETGVPGMAVAIVFEDEVVYADGFGVREVDTDDAVDADTVFQLASVSKPIGSTVMAGLVGDGIIEWDQQILEVDPDFALADPAVTESLTFADMYAHRSGLPLHAGDLIEDLGYERDEVLERLRHYPLDPFRSTYAYTNFGMTEAAVAAASAAGDDWETVSEERLYSPLGMTSTSSRFADYLDNPNRAIPHVRTDDGTWSAEYQRDPDAQTPAGGVSSSASDMAQWLRLQVNEGQFDGEEIVDPDALLATHTPHITSTGPRSPSARSSFYGLGWGVGYDDSGRTKLSHSGAFALGAATTVGILTNENLGIVVLTNGRPVGLSESLVEIFFDLASDGEVSRDWLGLYGALMESTLFPEPEVDYTTPPEGPAPARDPEAYVGTYQSDLYGPLEVTADAVGSLTLTLGPEPTVIQAEHYDGDTFWFVPSGENAVNPSSIVFDVTGDGPASSVTIEWLEGESPGLGIGTFTRG